MVTVVCSSVLGEQIQEL